MAKLVEKLQQDLQNEIGSYKTKLSDLSKLQQQRSRLDAQLNELNAVQAELNLLKPDAEVFKLVGPVLIKQEHFDAKENVNKRIGYINSEMKRVDDSLALTEKTLSTQRDKIGELQRKTQETSGAPKLT